MDYSTLVASRQTAGSIKNWINRDTVDPDTVLLDAQQLVWTSLRHYKMKAEVDGTMTASTGQVNLPTDFLDCHRNALRITGTSACLLGKGDETSVQARWQYDGSGARVAEIPQWWYISGTTAKFDTLPDQDYPYHLNYYQRPAPLGTATGTNFLTTDMPRLLRSACMLVAVEFEKEVGQGQFDRTYWQQQFDKQMAEAQRQSDRVDADTDSGPDFGDYCP